MAAKSRVVLLLRGVNVGGHRKIPMAALRELVEGVGCTEVATYVASGNVVCTSPLAASGLAARVATAIRARFGFDVDVVVRSAREWRAAIEANPFPDAAAVRPQLLHVGYALATPRVGAAKRLAAAGSDGERVAIVGDALFVDYAGGSGRSRITPAVLERELGSAATLRNWKTTLAIAELLAAG